MEKLTARALTALYAAGYTTHAISPVTVALVYDNRVHTARVHRVVGTPSPARIERDRAGVEDAVLLYVVPRITPNARVLAAREPRVILVGERDGVVLSPDLEVVLSIGPDAVRGRGRPPWGRWAVMRVLLMTRVPQSQREIARHTGISQGAVSNALRALGDDVVRGGGGWQATHPPSLWDRFVTEYPGPGGTRTSWFSLDPVGEQARRLLDATTGGSRAALVSGDVGADAVAPWHIPTHGVVYGRSAVNLIDLGFSPASPEEASLTFVLPEDPTIWLTAALFDHGPVADPMVLAAELRRGRGSDLAEALGHLRSVTLNNSDVGR